MARKTLRPMRPNPLMATLTAIVHPLIFVSDKVSANISIQGHLSSQKQYVYKSWKFIAKRPDIRSTHHP
jgi:hypothetical protein